MFPPEILALQEEILRHHPKLMEQLNSLPPGADEGEKLGEIAAWCGVQCDGMYVGKELIGLCSLLYDKLVESRQTIITINTPGKIIH